MKTVFTNGCFDILHPGHIDLLTKARKLGDKLIVGINSDESVRKIKGLDRPILNQEARKEMLLGLKSVDEVIIFEGLTPEHLIVNIKPDVLVKGGDWQLNEIIGAEYVKENGGEVVTIPLKEGFSSSSIVNKIKDETVSKKKVEQEKIGLIEKSLKQHLNVLETVLSEQTGQIEKCSEIVFETLSKGKKVLLCGNGGSAADAQHIAAEFVGRFETERRALPAIALTTDTSALTALANDYEFERIFSRQVEALANEGDCLLAISTSGNSPNVIAAVMTARSKGCRIIGFTGANGKKLASLSDECILVPSDRTARIQEAHITNAHIICEVIDTKIKNQK